MWLCVRACMYGGCARARTVATEYCTCYDTACIGLGPVAEFSWATRLLYAAVVVNTTLKPATFSYEDGLPIVSDWDNYMQQEVRSDPRHITLFVPRPSSSR